MDHSLIKSLFKAVNGYIRTVSAGFKDVIAGSLIDLLHRIILPSERNALPCPLYTVEGIGRMKTGIKDQHILFKKCRIGHHSV